MSVESSNYLFSSHNMVMAGGFVASRNYAVGNIAEAANNSGFDGVELVPTRKTHEQILSGALTSDELAAIKAAGQSFRGEKTILGAVLHPRRAKLMLGAFLMYPYVLDSHASLKRLQEENQDMPVAFQNLGFLGGAKNAGLKNRCLIVRPDVFEDLGVSGISDIGSRAKDMGFDGGLAIDHYQFSRPNKDGDYTLLHDLSRSLPAVWGSGENISLIHLSLGRADLESGVDSEGELADLYSGSNNTEIRQTIFTIGSLIQKTGKFPPIVFQIPYSGVNKVLGKSKVDVSDVERVASRVLESAKDIIGGI